MEWARSLAHTKFSSPASLVPPKMSSVEVEGDFCDGETIFNYVLEGRWTLLDIFTINLYVCTSKVHHWGCPHGKEYGICEEDIEIFFNRNEERILSRPALDKEILMIREKHSGTKAQRNTSTTEHQHNGTPAKRWSGGGVAVQRSGAERWRCNGDGVGADDERSDGIDLTSVCREWDWNIDYEYKTIDMRLFEGMLGCTKSVKPYNIEVFGDESSRIVNAVYESLCKYNLPDEIIINIFKMTYNVEFKYNTFMNALYTRSVGYDKVNKKL